MKKTTAGALALLAVAALRADAPARRTFRATYVGTVAAAPAGAKRMEIWIPLPIDSRWQEIRQIETKGPVPHTIGFDSAGNRVAHFVVEGEALARPVEVRASYEVTRREARFDALRDEGTTPQAIAASLKENRLVPLTPRVRALAKELAAGKTDDIAKARAFYDYLVDNGTYDKTTPGWGRGDSERFCDVKKGNCTDFHSAFMALARAEGIPVRFVIGFPLKPEKEGTVPGYHCWAFFHAAGKGWIPVDASDAAKLKDPAKKAYLFGNLDADRFDVSSGRDLRLAPPQKDGPVNFLLAPYVEVDGKAFTETKVALEYKDI